VAGALLCTVCITPASTAPVLKFVPVEHNPVSIGAAYQPLSDVPAHPEIPVYNANVPTASVIGTAPTTTAMGPVPAGLLGAQSAGIDYCYSWQQTGTDLGGYDSYDLRPVAAPIFCVEPRLGWIGL
jgi:hypothetical protein